MQLPRTPSFQLDGKRALVTGAGRGIGLAAAAALAQAGAHVTLLARSAAEIGAAAESIRTDGGAADALVCDVLAHDAVAAILASLPPFDVLVNNAGGNRPMPMQAVTEADYAAVMDLNVRGAFFVAQAVARGLIAAGLPGSLIHIGSQMGHVGGQERSLYCASKWAIEGMSKAFALDLAPFRIRSNTIAPTFIETSLTRGFLADAAFAESVLHRIKLGRIGTVEDIMGAVVYLASEASSLVTGTSLLVDGRRNDWARSSPGSRYDRIASELRTLSRMSEQRILTTHVGSLPRSARVTELVFAHEQGEPADPAEFNAAMDDAVETCVARQVAAGVDLVSDGEMSKISYATYIKDRISGFDGDSPRIPPADLEAFPTFLQRQAGSGGTPSYRRPRCVGPVALLTLAPLKDDVAHLQRAIERHAPTGAFMNAASPGVIALFQPNDFYPTQDAYLEALAEAMRPEYEAIVAAGLLLQLDSPDLGLGRHMMYKDRSDAEYLVLIEEHVTVLNHALRNIPADRVRMHVCWGNYEGPHHCDVELGMILPTLMRAKPQGLLFETSNPRHQHDWQYFRDMVAIVPENKVLIPGVLDSTTNFIEHPRVVAQRIEQFAAIVGRDRVIAGTDCGFSSFAGFGAVDPEIVYAKLHAMAEGAAIASEHLWAKTA